MIRYLSLAEYFWLAEQVTGVEAAVLTKAWLADWLRQRTTRTA